MHTCKCLNCSSINLCPKAFQPGVERTFWFASVIQTHLIGNLSVTEHFCHCDSPAFPCSLVYCWLCSCFPSRSGAPDDGRPRYGLCSFSTLLSVFSCSLAAFKPLLQRMGKCLQVIWLQIKCITLFTFFHVFFSPLFVGLVLVCSFDFYFLHSCTISANKWDIRTCNWEFPSFISTYAVKGSYSKENQRAINIWKKILGLMYCTKKSPFFTHAWQFGNICRHLWLLASWMLSIVFYKINTFFTYRLAVF